MSNKVWPISTVVKYLKNSLDSDVNIQSVLIKGEISNFTNHRSGHLYFSLKDSQAKMNCVMFSRYVPSMKIIPKEGMQVIIKAKVSLYEPQGNLQLYVTHMQSDGIGDLYLQFEALKTKLLKEGLFDENHKKEIPLYPKSIGILSAKTGAAIQDVLSIISRRWPIAEIKVYPTLVQGAEASKNIINSLIEADQNSHDIILLVRGGGSLEDLWCFNDEQLAYTIYQMSTCIVSGVGHESDTNLVDYVSDKRAPTPSAAAELVTPDMNLVKENLQGFQNRFKIAMNSMILKQRKEINYIKQKPIFSNSDYFIQNDKLKLMMLIKGLYNVEKKVQFNRQQLNNMNTLLVTNLLKYKETKQNKFSNNISLLDAFSPLKILKRGYSISLNNDKAIRSIDDVNENDEIYTMIDDGKIISRVTGRMHNERK